MLTPEQYSEKLYAEDEQLNKVKQSIEDSGIRDVSVVPGYGRLLTLLVKSSGAKSALEIGALGGYSGICLARGLSEGGKLLSLELKEENAAMARSNMAAAGYGEIVDYRVGPALDSLIELERQGQRFDFFFIDADKENYPVYLEYAIKLALPGAIIAGDNTLLRGRTLNPDKNGPAVLAMRKFNEMIARDERLLSTFLPAFDGLALALVK
ncbi:class I SAM-dependent methyltransferase [Paenibacillus woosongensis]|uniref:Class I SAM-dependent methyltransferase n=1 Tax=Paenibacillus woosongensis TaxID=307580 RepID=A0AA95I6W7_9BACL|nr:class I SAM-dependent methyltransferase [Paenibacillus woosongensis]WHX50835.1 class I SAM-dependent methyltransferase [Paenibacillus woosongensis]